MTFRKKRLFFSRAWLALHWIAILCARTGITQSVSTTTVQGTVYLANGAPASGTLTLNWPAFVTSNGLAVAADTMYATIGANGFVSVNLTPNLGAAPAGLFYTAVYHLSDGSTSTEYRWRNPSELLRIFSCLIYQSASGVIKNSQYGPWSRDHADDE